MSTTIKNLALGFAGDQANQDGFVASRKDAAADHLAAFYPIAVDAVLEMHNWGFATRRETLTLRAETKNGGYPYVYDRPNEALKIWGILPQNAGDDYLAYSLRSSPQEYNEHYPQNAPLKPKFKCETSATGEQIILTNMPDADVRATFRVTDENLFSPLFKIAVAKLLASFIAGPLYKGAKGMGISNSLLQQFQSFYATAIEGQGDEGHEIVEFAPAWITGR